MYYKCLKRIQITFEKMKIVPVWFWRKLFVTDTGDVILTDIGIFHSCKGFPNFVTQELVPIVK